MFAVEYPLLHAGEHTDPDAVEGKQLEYVISTVSARGRHGFGEHTPAAAPNDQNEQAIVNDAVAVYPLRQTGVQVPPLTVELLHVVE